MSEANGRARATIRPPRPPPGRGDGPGGRRPRRAPRSTAIWDRLIAGRSCAARISRFDPDGLPVPIACEVTEFDIGRYVSPKEARRLDRVVASRRRGRGRRARRRGRLGRRTRAVRCRRRRRDRRPDHPRGSDRDAARTRAVEGEPVHGADDDAERDVGARVDAIRLDRTEPHAWRRRARRARTRSVRRPS